MEGQVNQVRTLKRQMYGRAGVELLRTRLIPLPTQSGDLVMRVRPTPNAEAEPMSVKLSIPKHVKGSI